MQQIKILPRNVWLLTLCQALMTSCASLIVFSGSLVGNTLSKNEQLSTLPVALFVIGTAANTVPTALMMRKYGRRQVFVAVAASGVILALFSAWTIHQGSFFLFSLSTLFLGTTISAVQQFRFAAIESVESNDIAKAASQVLLGGIAAAFIGPEIAVMGQHLFPADFAGSFVLLAVLYAIGFLLLLGFANVNIKQHSALDQTRDLAEIIKQPVFIAAVLAAVIGYSVMSFIMTATPISMHVMQGHSIEDTKWVIQSHIMAMFLPSLISAWIIKVLGIARMMLTGILAFVICIVLAYSGQELLNYWTSLILLGIGWNFLFIGGTTLLPQSYVEAERFKVQAVNEFMVFGTQAVASLSAGWVLFQLGWEKLLLLCIPLLVLQIVVIAYWQRSRLKKSIGYKSP